MVFIENRVSYVSNIKNEKLLAFSSLLFSTAMELPALNELPEVDQIYYKLIHAIQNSNVSDFNKAYQIFSKRIPSKENPSPFVHNDLLIFTLVCGIVKFNIDRKWIKEVLAVKTQNPITNTFENIIDGNEFNNNNLPEIVISLMSIIENSSYPEDFLNKSYLKIRRYKEEYFSSDFIKLTTLNAIDTIVILKDVHENGEYSLLKRFEICFLKRIKIFGVLLYNILVAIILYGISKIIGISTQLKEFFEQYNLIFGILGVGLLGGSNLISFFKRMLINLLLTLFGYPKEKIK